MSNAKLDEEEEEEEIKELDDKWIRDFEINDKLYEDYYLEDVYYSTIHYVYVDRQNNIEKMIEENFLMSVKNEISRVEINQILKKSTINDNKKYSLLDVLKCNITLKPEDISNFITASNINDYFDKFVTSLKTIIGNNNAIIFEKTINMFQDLNDLIIILYECQPSSSTKTRRSHHNNTKTLKKTI